MNVNDKVAEVKKKVEEFDDSLTEEERAAPSCLEWSDETLARGVRAIAATMKDDAGTDAAFAAAALAVLTGLLKRRDVDMLKVKFGDAEYITVFLSETAPVITSAPPDILTLGKEGTGH